MEEFKAKYVAIWSDGTIAGFNRETVLYRYLDKCKQDEYCDSLDCKIYNIENNKIEEIQVYQ